MIIKGIYIYLSTYEDIYATAVANKLYLTRTYLFGDDTEVVEEVKYILPSEFKILMKILPEGFSYIGYLNDYGTSICDNEKHCFTPYNTKGYAILHEDLFE